MPNGHGGIVRFGSPALIVIIMLAVFFNDTLAATPWYRPLLFSLSVLFGWKFSLHLHMWRSLEYGGALLDEEAHRRARVRFGVGVLCYSAVSAAAVWLLTR